MAKRHNAALFITSPGACNPSGIAHAILDACAEIRAAPNHTGTAQITSDPAVRLMVRQLNYICGLQNEADVLAFGRDMDACEAAEKETD